MPHQRQTVRRVLSPRGGPIADGLATDRTHGQCPPPSGLASNPQQRGGLAHDTDRAASASSAALNGLWFSMHFRGSFFCRSGLSAGGSARSIFGRITVADL